MNSKEYLEILEAYNKVCEQKIGIDATKEGGPEKLLQKIIKDNPKYGGGQVHRTGLQKANYEPEGNLVDEQNMSEEDLYGYVLQYLISEGYAEDVTAAMAIMKNMGDQWKRSILESALNENVVKNMGDNVKNAARMFRMMTGIEKIPQKPPSGPANLSNIATKGPSKPAPTPQRFKIGTPPPKPSVSRPRNPGVSLPTRSPHVAAAAAGLQSYNTGDATLKGALKRGDYKPQQGPKNPDQGLSKAQSFDKAFKAARTSGQKEFTWNNKRYNTKMK